jgi:hypothetical protein
MVELCSTKKEQATYVEATSEATSILDENGNGSEESPKFPRICTNEK